MKISFITTVYNEEKTITVFLQSLYKQTKNVKEIIIVDGGSSDKTIEVITKHIPQFKRKRISIKVLQKNGNRSVGRNEAINHAQGDVILCSDAGNILDKKWVYEISKPFSSPHVDVVSGYYKDKALSLFQKCLIPYVLVMSDKVDEKNFLPATRSIAFTKSIWKKVGKFPEEYSHNEDYVFANRLRNSGAVIVFAKKAIVYWIPRTTVKEAFVMFYRFAFGDIESNMIRPKVLFVFTRYSLVLYSVFLAILYRNSFLLLLLSIAFVSYIIWSVKKNYRYVKSKKAFIYLPLLQFTSDAAVLLGSSLGFIKRILKFNFIRYFKSNSVFLGIIALYIVSMLFTIHSGAPNSDHPYPYHMDEWHQLQAVYETFKKGTPNTPGAANGTMFHFVLSGFYLIPFIVSHYIQPTEMKVFDLEMRARVFDVLRFSTILWGVLSLFVLGKIADLVGVSKKITIFVFTFTPLWLALSGYFKYDIGLLFWFLLSVLFLFRFIKSASQLDYFLACFFSGVTFAVKVSAIPFLPVLVIAYFFIRNWKKELHFLCGGLAIYAITILLFGMPDAVFGKGNILDYLYNNILQSPALTSDLALGMPAWIYLIFIQYPYLFGPGILFGFVVGSIFTLYSALKKGIASVKIEVTLILLTILFFLSIVPLRIYGGGNRSLVLLPFLALLCAYGVERLKKKITGKLFYTFVIVIFCVTQSYLSFALLSMKILPLPQERASFWIKNHIPKNTLIGIENIPIYQQIPDIIQKEFYFLQSNKLYQSYYTYQVIDSKTAVLPSVIVITNDIEPSYTKHSSKTALLTRLENENYRKLITFLPDLQLLPINALDYNYSGLYPTPYTISVYSR